MMADTTTLNPIVEWAQRSDDIYLTIQISDPQDVKIDISQTSLSFSAAQGEKRYKFNFNFFENVNPEESKQHISPRCVFLVIRKEKVDAEFWPRLLKETVKPNFLKVDFSRWKDEDEDEDVTPDNGFFVFLFFF
jgi:prostaglandin-E synthase